MLTAFPTVGDATADGLSAMLNQSWSRFIFRSHVSLCSWGGHWLGWQALANQASWSLTKQLDRPVAQISQCAIVQYPIMHHFVTEMCTCVHISVTKWCIVGYLSNHCWICEMGHLNMLLPLTTRHFHELEQKHCDYSVGVVFFVIFSCNIYLCKYLEQFFTAMQLRYFSMRIFY